MYAVISVVAGTVLPFMTAHGLISLKNTYTMSHVVFAVAMLSTVLIQSVSGATLLLGLLGISWAITMWIPFALIGEYLVLEHASEQEETTPLLLEDNRRELDAGIVLGVHNMYVVFPQFVVAIIAALIFAVSDASSSESSVGVAWVLRFGGLMAVIAALLSRSVVDVDSQ